jgi:hypothetical protein
MVHQHESAASIKLRDGRVLVIGGRESYRETAWVDIFDPATRSWSSVAMTGCRMNPTATLLLDGRVLVAGGFCFSELRSAELFDPATGSWSLVAPMNLPRGRSSASLLDDGRVLIAGAMCSTSTDSSAELYNPTSNSWVLVGRLERVRPIWTSLWRLPNRTVLAAGGFDCTGTASNAELLDPVSQTWSPTSPMVVAARSGHTATLLVDGSVLVAGGTGPGPAFADLAEAETFALAAPHSLALDGASGHAEVPNAAKLNLAGDWTIEAWFKDETVGGYDHDWAKIVSKMDANVSGEGPYYLAIGLGLLKAGSLHEGLWRSVVYDLAAAGVTAGVWHHAAATLQASTRRVTLYLDGMPVMIGTLDALGAANDLPLSIGRSGTVGNYWTGKIDDLRIWNLTRTAAQIAATYQTEFATAPAGLIANWKFDEATGTTAADSTASPADAVLDGGASFSTDIHP